MDEFYKRKGLWIGLAVLGVIFLCVMLCIMGAFFAISSRSGMTYGPLPLPQPPAGGESVAPPVVQYSPGPTGMPRHGGFNPFSILMRMFFLGLMVLLGIGLLKRFCWGRRHWAHHYHGPRPPGRPGGPPAGMWPKDKAGKHPPHPAWGPWAWHAHGGCWEPEQEPAAEGDEAAATESGATEAAATEAASAESEYTGPQE